MLKNESRLSSKAICVKRDAIRKTCFLYVVAMIAIITMVVSPIKAFACECEETGIDVVPTEVVVGVGEAAYASATGTDNDLVTGATYPTCDTEEDTVTITDTGPYTYNTAGTHTVTVKANDAILHYDDPEATKDATIIAVEVVSITADKTVACADSNITFTAVTNPAGHGDIVDWSDGGNPSTKDNSATFTTKWTALGDHTITATCGTSSKTCKVTVIGGDIKPSNGVKLYVWCPSSKNAEHRKTFERKTGQQSGTTYSWSITNGSDKAHISGSTTGQSVEVEPDAASGNKDDVTLHLIYTYDGVDCSSDITLSVCRPSSVNSTWDPPTDICKERSSDTCLYAIGKEVKFTFKDQLGNIMPEEATWDEKLVLVSGSGTMQTGGGTCEEDGTSYDWRVTCMGQNDFCGMPDTVINHDVWDQRIIVNGWGAGSVCANASTYLPAFWRFKIEYWDGHMNSGVDGAKATTVEW